MTNLARQEPLERFRGMQLERRRDGVEEKEESSERLLSSHDHQHQLTATVRESSGTDISRVVTCHPQPVHTLLN
jgi:hypothetical protein